MAHTTHTTDAIVLSSVEGRDADKLFWLLTDEIGLIAASARSVREEGSKLRYALQDLALIRASVVRGKAGWKLIGAELQRAYTPLSGEAQRAYGRLAALVRRLTPPDEHCPRIHDTLLQVREALHASPAHVPEFELLAVARILDELGYLAASTATATLVSDAPFTPDTAAAVHEHRAALLRSVNEAIADSQL